jgi:hypothetical protein
VYHISTLAVVFQIANHAYRKRNKLITSFLPLPPSFLYTCSLLPTFFVPPFRFRGAAVPPCGSTGGGGALAFVQ